jgi:hypothetical protein
MKTFAFRLTLALLLSTNLAQAQVVRTVGLKAWRIVYDPVTNRLFASLASDSGHADSIAVINPATAAVERFVPVGSQPNRLALSDDGRYLYVGLEGPGAIRRVEVGAGGQLTPGPEFPVGKSASGSTLRPGEIAVLPGNPHSIAVWRGDGEGVAVYDDGVMRPSVGECYNCASLAFNDTPERLYGINSESTAATLSRFVVGPTGVTRVDETAQFFSAAFAGIRYAGGLLFSGGGVADPETLETVAHLPISYTAAVDMTRQVVYGMVSPAQGSYLAAVDLQSGRRLWMTPLTNQFYATLVLCGENRFAYNNVTGEIVLVDVTGTYPLTVAVAGTGGGTISSMPDVVECGTSDIRIAQPEPCQTLLAAGRTVTLTAAADARSRFVGWDEPECAGGSVTATGPRICTARFEQSQRFPALQVPITTNEVAYSSLTGKVYATVPGADPIRGNSLIEIDPATGAPDRAVWVGSEPNHVTITDDGRYAYVGLDGAGALRRVELTTLTAETAHTLGRDPQGGIRQAISLAAQPGNPDVVLVGRGRAGVWGGAHGVVVYENGAARPVTAAGDYQEIAFGSSPARAYGAGEGTLNRLSVTASGVSVLDATTADGLGTPLASVNDLLFSRSYLLDGARPSPSRPYPVGRLSVFPGSVAIDPATRTLYSRRQTAWSEELRAFDIDSFRPRWSVYVPTSLGYQPGLTLAGPGRIAFRGGTGNVLLLDTTAGHPLSIVQRGSGVGTVGAASESESFVWDGATLFGKSSVVKLTATPDPTSRFLGWQGDADCADGQVTMSGPRSCTAVFANLTGGLVAAPLRANALAYSPATGKIYASVPSSEDVLGNSLTVIDPTTGAIGPSAWVGSEPNQLAMTTDGRTLYVGIDGAAGVRRVDLAENGTPVPGAGFDLGWGEGTYGTSYLRSAVRLAAVPWDRDSVAVIRSYSDAVTFTNGSPRPDTLTASTIAFSDVPPTLYAGGWDYLAPWNLTARGFAEAAAPATSQDIEDLVFDGGRLYTNKGLVIDAASRTVVATIAIPSTVADAQVVPDSSSGVIQFLGTSRNSRNPVILRYDVTTLEPLDSVEIPGLAGQAWTGMPNGSPVRIGRDRLAFRSASGQVAVFSRTTALTFGLEVTSSLGNPDITVEPADLTGQKGATTPFVRSFAPGTVVTLTAPATFDGNLFNGWIYSGYRITSERTLTLTLAASAKVQAQYRWPAPTITSIRPAVGPVSGGTQVLISGTGFKPGAAVSFRYTAASSVTVTGPTSTTAITPAQDPGAVFVQVTNPDGQYAYLIDGFVYGAALLVNRPTLRFGVLAGSRSGGAQQVSLSAIGVRPVRWSAVSDKGWLVVSPSAGTGSAALAVSVDPGHPDLQRAGTVSGRITISSADVSTPATIDVQVNVMQAGSATAPFGQIDTPAQGANDVVGAIGVTGWVLDDVGVTAVRIYRDCLAFEAWPPCQSVGGHAVVYIADAVFVPGARPDVERAFPGYPQAYRAGWGYQLLTNMLPHVPANLPFGGQGTLHLFAFAEDADGHLTLLGRDQSDHTPTAITITNDAIAKPFGAIDTPGQGETVSGVFANFGWVLTPDIDRVSGNGDILVPTDGSTMRVYIDGQWVTNVAFNQCRGDVGALPAEGVYCDDDVSSIFGNDTPMPTFTARSANPTRYRNLDAGRGAIGVAMIDTTTLANGMHSIAWGVIDSAGRPEGIGSRFFTVANPIDGASASASATAAPDRAVSDGAATPQNAAMPPPVPGAAEMVAGLSSAAGEVLGRVGFDPEHRFEAIPIDADGIRRVRLPESGRLELHLGRVDAGHLVVGDSLRDLPAGSTLDHRNGAFTWMPGPGQVGTYRLAFLRDHSEISISVTVGRESTTSPGDSEVRVSLDVPASGQTLSGAVHLAGWALDLRASIGSGIGFVQVWGRRQDMPSAAAVLLGTASLGQARPDIARAFGPQFGAAGYELEVPGLERGSYEITAFAWSQRTARWEAARTVNVTVR